jgi:hypothetical protein
MDRICEVTRKPLGEDGYVIHDGEMYLSTEDLARAFCLGLGLSLEEAFNQDIIYWTEFE